MEVLVHRDKVRGYLNPKHEWLSKVSDREYSKWEIAFRRAMTHRDVEDGVEMDKKIWEEIGYKEKQYQEAKKKYLDTRKRSQELDKQINTKLDLLHDLVATPSTCNAVLRMDKYEPVTASTKLTRHDKKHIPVGYRKLYEEEVRNKNGRIYPKYSHKALDWMHGELWESKRR